MKILNFLVPENIEKSSSFFFTNVWFFPAYYYYVNSN